MKIAIAGASGLIGNRLIPFLESKGHRVTKIVRSASSNGEIHWDPSNHQIDATLLEGMDVIINLAGENIASGRWTEDRKKKILNSRIDGTRTLSEAVQKLQSPPQLFINASAIGIYGNRGNETLTEDSAPGAGFLADVCQQWEKAIVPLPHTRVVMLRFGAVLDPNGGILGKMLLPFKIGLGGVIGGGEQYISWVDISDLLDVFEFVISNNMLTGPVNAVAPDPVTNYEYTKTIGEVLSRPTFFSMPEFVARFAFGEMADEMILCSEKVLPSKLTANGFSFKHPKLKQSLEHLLA
ncbi:MAG: TIGR01777 family oxidoreductase [Parachlamydiales bacterium]|jgi:hypothetical protein